MGNQPTTTAEPKNGAHLVHENDQNADRSLRDEEGVSMMVQNVRLERYRRSASYKSPWLRRGYVVQFHGIERGVLREVVYCCGKSLKGLKILDIGCGNGAWIREFIKWGADPELIIGVDALEERIAEAQHLTPTSVRYIRANAARLEFPDNSFDLVVLFQTLSVMTDEVVRGRMAAEARRVVKPEGAILFYDFRYTRPGLRDVMHSLRKREIKHLFPGCDYHLRSVQPIPPVSRALAAFVPSAWNLLNLIPPLHTNYIGSIRKKSTDQKSVPLAET